MQLNHDPVNNNSSQNMKNSLFTVFHDCPPDKGLVSLFFEFSFPLPKPLSGNHFSQWENVVTTLEFSAIDSLQFNVTDTDNADMCHRTQDDPLFCAFLHFDENKSCSSAWKKMVVS